MKQDLLFLELEGFRLPYRIYGQGSELLLAFHGFGQSGDAFAVFEPSLGDRYTLIAFDFFYHGEEAMDLNEQLPPFMSAHLAKMIEQLLWQYRKVGCSLMGYSQGGRLVLGVIHRMPHRIQEIFLIAPDGLKPNYLHQFISGTALGRTMGWHTVQKPGNALVLVHLFNKTGLISQKLRQLIVEHLATKDQRLKVYRIWLVLKNYHTNLNLARHYLSTRPIRVELFFGKYDAIIPSKLGFRFLKRLQGKGEMHLLDSGHQLLQKHVEISRIILNSGKTGQK